MAEASEPSGSGPARRPRMGASARRYIERSATAIPAAPVTTAAASVAPAWRTGALAGWLEIEGELGALLAAVVRRLHHDLLAALPLVEGAAHVEPQLELGRRVEQGLCGGEPEDAHQVVVQAVEAVAVLVGPDDVRIGRRRDPLSRRHGYRALFFADIERMNDSIGIAVSDSIESVPRAPRLTDTRAIVSASFASTMFTKS